VSTAGVESHSSVAEFVDSYRTRVSLSVAQLIAHLNGLDGHRLVAGPSLTESRKVIGIGECVDGSLVLAIEDAASPYSGTNVNPQSPTSLSVADLRRSIIQTGASRLSVGTNTGLHSSVVAAATHEATFGEGEGRWLVLITPRSADGPF
jgi:hypothetical protein